MSDRLLRQLLELPAPFDAQGHLAPRELALTPEAKAVFAEYHHTMSRMCAQDGILHPVEPAAEETAEQVLRMEGLLQFLADCDSRSITARQHDPRHPPGCLAPLGSVSNH